MERTSPRERSAWWAGAIHGAVAGLTVGAVSAAYLLAGVVERAAGLVP